MVVDLFLVYQFIRRLATPFNKWDAYKTGVIDDKGSVLVKKKDRTSEQKKSFKVFDVMVRNMKRLLAKLPGGSTRLASYAAALFLIKEHKAFTPESLITEDIDEDSLEESLSLFNELYSNYTTLSEAVNPLLLEKLKKSDDMGTWIKDFYNSDAPQFKGKSKAKRRQMAVAAKLDAMDENLQEGAKPMKWKKAGPNGEIEATVNGQRFKIEKALDHNLRHKGEYKVYIWDKRSEEWEWDDTIYGKTNAKARVFFHLKEEAELEEEPANNVGSGNIAGMDGSAFSKAAQKRWTSSNKSNKKKKLRDIMGVKS